MMASFFSSFSFMHKECNKEIHRLIQKTLDDNNNLRMLRADLVKAMNDIQELKAINDYQCFTLEQKIISLEAELIEARKPKTARHHWNKKKNVADLSENKNEENKDGSNNP